MNEDNSSSNIFIGIVQFAERVTSWLTDHNKRIKELEDRVSQLEAERKPYE